MRNKILVLLALVMLLFLPMRAMAEEKNFPAGSLIIGMDSFYQPDADGGALEAYGMIYYLLAHTDAEGLHDITLNWVINDAKTSKDGIDLEIEDNSIGVGEAVVKLYVQGGGTAALTYKSGDTRKKVSYAGGPFIVDAADVASARTVIDANEWLKVDVHVAEVPFAAMVFREMIGTPPKIALMNDQEDKTKGNARILEAYLRLAGLCSDTYEVVTPNEIRDGKLRTGGYNFLWAPHWDGYKKYDGDNDGNGTPDVEDIIKEIKMFLQNGKGMLAECSSIEVFEHSVNGHFLTDKGIGHNEGTNDPDQVLYDNVTGPNAQVGDFAFDPAGGHLHNWRPYQSGDKYNFDDEPDVSGGNSTYLDTVSRFTIDDTNDNGVIDDSDWDYYVGGYAFGDTRNGYVVYLGGHSYAKCKGAISDLETMPGVHTLDFEFKKDLSNENFTLEVISYSYSQTKIRANATTNDTTIEVDSTSGIIAGDTIGIKQNNDSINWTTVDEIIDSDTLTIVDSMPSTAGADNDVYKPVTVNFTKDDLTAIAGDPLEVDLTTASIHKKKKLIDVTFTNNGENTITIDSISISWTGGHADQKFKKLTDQRTDVKVYDRPELASEAVLAAPDFTTFSMEPGGGGDDAFCTVGAGDNDDCEWGNIAAIKYVLNTLFNIKYQITSHEYVRSAPVVNHPYLYQGSFEYPSYLGHFRKYDVTKTAEQKTPEWDTASSGHISNANNSNVDGRKIYTSKDNGDGTWSKINFDALNIGELRVPLNVTPVDGNDADEIAVITRVRGKYWDPDSGASGAWVEQSNKLGGIMHSAPVIVEPNSRNHFLHNNTEIAFVGDLYGMLRAIETATGDEKWAFIPRNLLGMLKNDRTDPNAPDDFAAVDGSPTAKEVYYDHDDNPDNDKEWRTILVSPEGSWGNYIFALDVHDPNPDDWKVLWEVTDTAAAGGGMGHAFRVAIDKVKWDNGDGTYGIKWAVFVATGYRNFATDPGGINVYAFDLKTGAKLWDFSEGYLSSVNDIPGAITLMDTDGDSLADRVFVGDMEGRMWDLNAVDGTNPHGTEVVGGVPKQIPLWNAGVGNPISVSPAVIKINPVIVIFGTGGTDWASTANDKRYYIYAINASDTAETPTYAGGAGTEWWTAIQLASGEKVWSSPTIAAGQIFIATAIGSMESTDARQDLAAEGESNGTLRSISLNDGTTTWSRDDIGKTRGSIYVDRQHIYLTTIDNEITQVGGEGFQLDSTNVDVMDWMELF